MTADVTSPLPIYTLLCHSDVERAMICFGSLHARCKDPFRHTVIDDGSLTEADRDRLLGRFDGLTILSRREQDDRVVPLLKGRPNCLKYRTEHAFALKLIDPPLMTGGALALCDGDIYFVRDFEGLDLRAEPDKDLVFMRDWTSAYSVPFLKRAFGKDRLPLVQNLNGGLIYSGPSTFDLDFIEWFLGRDDFRTSVFLLEQTAWAALGGRKRSFYHDPAQVAFPTKARRFSPRLVALHFIRVLRDLLDDPAYMADVERAEKAEPGRVPKLMARPATIDGPMMGSLTRLRRIFSPDHPPWHESKGPAPR
jgi:hypothetical protein